MRFPFYAAIGLGIGLLSLEVLLHFLPVNSGIRMANTTAETPYAHYLPRQPYLYSAGWGMGSSRHGITNRQGFSNSRDFADDANALVIGDSFIESFMIDYPDTVQGQLDARLGKVYAPAASGNGLADALQLARQFLPTTHAKTVVIFVEPSDLIAIDERASGGHNFFAISGNTVALQHVAYVESKAKETVLKSALLRYAYYNLKFPQWFKMKTEASPGSAADDRAALAAHRARRELALNYLMGELQKLQEQYGTRFVFLVDGDRAAIYTPGKSVPTWPGDERPALLRHIRQAGFGLVDMQPLFQSHWRLYRERMDFLPMDGHWNKVGHYLAAQGVLAAIGSRQ